MKTKNKLITLLLLSTGAATATSLLNKCLKLSATSKNILEENRSYCYHWRLGNIHYTKTGNGKPILLVHDLDSSSSGYEWNQLIPLLKDHYTVYTIDLLGCGRSEKPALTYTNYLYVQLITEFIKSEIGHRTDIITTGKSTSIGIMACNYNPDLFNKLMFISPESVVSSTQIPNKYAKYYKTFLDLPILGTLLYNIANSRKTIKERFVKEYFYNPYSVKSSYVDAYYESSHLGNSPKSIYASVQCNYTKANIMNALRQINHSLYLVNGSGLEQLKNIISEYLGYNPAIEYSNISKAKYLPQLETPQELSKVIKMFFD